MTFSWRGCKNVAIDVRNDRRFSPGVASLIARRGLVCVVPRARADRKLSTSLWRNHIEFHRAESAVLSGVRRIVAERVLISNVSREFGANGVHAFQIVRKESEPAGGFRESAQIFFRFAHHLLVVLAVLIAEDAHRINQRA